MGYNFEFATTFSNSCFVRTLLKFIYSEKARKFCEIFTLHLMYCQSKVRWRFRKILWPSQNIWPLLSINLQYQQLSIIKYIFQPHCESYVHHKGMLVYCCMVASLSSMWFMMGVSCLRICPLMNCTPHCAASLHHCALCALQEDPRHDKWEIFDSMLRSLPFSLHRSYVAGKSPR